MAVSVISSANTFNFFSEAQRKEVLRGNFCRYTRHKEQIRTCITNSSFVTFSLTQNISLGLRHLRYLVTFIFCKIKINWDFLFLFICGI